MNYRHFTTEEHCCLREYYVKGKSYREIARLLGRNVSSVTLKKNLALINARPVKALQYRTPQDLFNENLAKCCT